MHRRERGGEAEEGEYSTKAEAPAVGRSVSASAGTDTVTGSSNASSNDDSCAYNVQHATHNNIQQVVCNRHQPCNRLKSQASSNDDSCAARNRTVTIRRQRNGYLRPSD